MKHRHFIIHKPYKMLSQFKLERQNSKRLLGELYDFPLGVMAIGRLDEKSEGLLLITTDGKVSARVNGSGVEKEYYAQVDGVISEEAMDLMRSGVQISIEGKSYLTSPAQCHALTEAPDFPERSRRIRSDRHGPTSWVSITLTEGKYRQVRKMTAVVGYPTLRLVRVRVGDIQLGEMQPGDVREVLHLDM